MKRGGFQPLLFFKCICFSAGLWTLNQAKVIDFTSFSQPETEQTVSQETTIAPDTLYNAYDDNASQVTKITQLEKTTQIPTKTIALRP